MRYAIIFLKGMMDQLVVGSYEHQSASSLGMRHTLTLCSTLLS